MWPFVWALLVVGICACELPVSPTSGSSPSSTPPSTSQAPFYVGRYGGAVDFYDASKNTTTARGSGMEVTWRVSANQLDVKGNFGPDAWQFTGCQRGANSLSCSHVFNDRRLTLSVTFSGDRGQGRWEMHIQDPSGSFSLALRATGTWIRE
jgi:hypothetical protein